MPIKRYSDFDTLNVQNIPTESKISINTYIEDEPIKEEVLLTPKDDSTSTIEILEERIIKFNNKQTSFLI